VVDSWIRIVCTQYL